MKRIFVAGLSGSGKTTLAVKLARRLSLPYIHSDSLYWESNWQPVRETVLRERIAAATQNNEWVFDGNYFSVRDLVWQRADTVVWLDFSLPIILGRICIRNLRRVVTREQLWNGNRETWGRALGGIYYSLQTFRRRRLDYPQLLAEFPHLRVVHLRSPRQAQRWLQTLCPI